MEKILALIAVSLGKKATVYAVGRYYGFPRLYRRFAEFNRRVTSNRQTLRRRQEAMKFVFRIPNKILAFFRDIFLLVSELNVPNFCYSKNKEH